LVDEFFKTRRDWYSGSSCISEFCGSGNVHDPN
jgi:hypothetical protein